MKKTKFKTVDEYLSTLSEKAKCLLEDLRKTIKKTAPEAEEVISYNMPAFKFRGRILVYYAAHTEHIGFYPGSTIVNDVFKEDLVNYKTSKGTIQFPIDKDIPERLIKNIIKFRVQQNLEKEKAKIKKKL
jgi:uncharacterized protein YdhG (YjbR/CyaY superfamily)